MKRVSPELRLKLRLEMMTRSPTLRCKRRKLSWANVGSLEGGGLMDRVARAVLA